MSRGSFKIFQLLFCSLQIRQIERDPYLFPSTFPAVNLGYLAYSYHCFCHSTRQKFHTTCCEIFCKNLKMYLAPVGYRLKIFYQYLLLHNQVLIYQCHRQLLLNNQQIPSYLCRFLLLFIVLMVRLSYCWNLQILPVRPFTITLLIKASLTFCLTNYISKHLLTKSLYPLTHW